MSVILGISDELFNQIVTELQLTALDIAVLDRAYPGIITKLIIATMQVEENNKLEYKKRKGK